MRDLFTLWLQRRLNFHSRQVKEWVPLEEDGILGPATRSALLRFQIRRRLAVTGTATDETVRNLRATNTRRGVEMQNPPVETMPPWLAEMTRRMGLREKEDNKALSTWLRAGKFLGDPAKLPWCGDAVETCFARTLEGEALPSNPFWAQAWKDFGIEVEPRVGAVGVIRWSSRAGHVGLVIDWKPSQVKLRGGNQSNMIRDSWFPLSRFLAFRWPRTYPVRDYPRIGGGAETGGSTR